MKSLIVHNVKSCMDSESRFCPATGSMATSSRVFLAESGTRLVSCDGDSARSRRPCQVICLRDGSRSRHGSDQDAQDITVTAAAAAAAATPARPGPGLARQRGPGPVLPPVPAGPDLTARSGLARAVH